MTEQNAHDDDLPLEADDAEAVTGGASKFQRQQERVSSMEKQGWHEEACTPDGIEMAKGKRSEVV